ncbi:MAG: MMPL family transporter [Candidatus Omnitrophica bacterium]|nr:MMPL family transporter [Candidatus Omnitrophota bacterium]
MRKIIYWAVRRPKTVIAITVIATVISLLQFFRVKIDTDPENMLPEKEFVRIFHHEVKREFALYDYIVLGIVNQNDPHGVFNPDTLEKVHEITNRVKKIDGVIGYELISPANKDDIQQAGAGTVSFQWLMGQPPYAPQQALQIGSRAMDNPLFYDTVVSQDAKAVCIYVPIKEKNLSYAVAKQINSILREYRGEEKYYLTGLPLAEDAFGEEMFIQMGISAPLAMLIILGLLLLFFKKLQLVVAPLAMAAAVVIITMGLMVGLGFPIHIMSSMIPIFLMPIAVLDSVHILSEFFDKYRKFKDSNKTIVHVMEGLFSAMLFTSLTTIAGFFSLSFAPIPPIQVFGIFVAIGVAVAWVLTMTFIPAYVVLIDPRKFQGYGAKDEHMESGLTARVLSFMRDIAVNRWKAVLIGVFILIVVSLWGITRIRINDNPVKWFAKGQPIRVADRVLNQHFGGTYNAYLVLQAQDSSKDAEIFKEPAMLRYVEKLQGYLQEKGDVGKSTTLADVVKKVYYELLGGDKKNNLIPDSKNAVAQTLISFENSHKPDDLWHFTTPDYSKLNIWLQLKSGDNRDMNRVFQQVKGYFAENPPPYPLNYDWAGLTYINMVWQDRMVTGMLFNFLGSFIIVLFMMTVLFNSPFKGLISMIPMSITILFIYGSLGFFGRDYDMPVAVLSALTLGLSIDFAIHFLEHSIIFYEKDKDWGRVSQEVFRGPARAILRNALVIAIAFLPLLLSPLVPYNTVGIFMCLIMLASSVSTLLILPAMITAFPGLMLGKTDRHFLFSCRQCMLTALFVVGTVIYVLLAYTNLKWHSGGLIVLGVMVFLAVVCYRVSKGRSCLKD